MTGKKIGRIKVINFAFNKEIGGHAYFYCICDCGKKLTIRGSKLREGNLKTKSCGCYSIEIGKKFLIKYANSKAHKGKGNPRWKGEKASVGAIHQWLTRNFKKTTCGVAGCENKNLDWALIKDKKYEHDRNNFFVLCRSHHLKYDYTQERKNKISIALRKKNI